MLPRNVKKKVKSSAYKQVMSIGRCIALSLGEIDKHL